MVYHNLLIDYFSR